MPGLAGIPELPELRALAAEEGYAVEKAIAKDRWRLMRNGEFTKTAAGSAAPSMDAAIRFRRTLPNAR